ncbi:hypothetical protein LTS10_002905 [Elasticomyces elasticus]|nr:hypothetical protein LTS10_002905 [Elasticomyces elasticus]
MSHNGREGAHAAEEVKGVFKGFNNATENLRKDINSFADNLVDKNHSSSTHTTRTTHTTTGSGGIHPDAKNAGHVLERGVNSAEHKLDGTASGSRSVAR